MHSEPQASFVNRTVCYMDLMGFGNYVVSNASKAGEMDRVATLLLEVKNYVKGYKQAGLEFQTLSDSIFIATRDESSDGLQTLITCCQDLFIMFLLGGFLSRGGVSTGPCLITNEIILGEPVVRAVRLEESVAEYPRVILASRTVALLRRCADPEFFKSRISRRFDGPYFINPFSSLIDIIEQCHEDWALARDRRDSQTAGELLIQRDANLKKVHEISKFISRCLEELQEDKKQFGYYYWFFQFYTEQLSRIKTKIGTEVNLPEFRI